MQKFREDGNVLKVTQLLGILVQCLFLLLYFLVFPIFFFISEFFKTKNILADIFCFLSKYIYVI